MYVCTYACVQTRPYLVSIHTLIFIPCVKLASPLRGHLSVESLLRTVNECIRDPSTLIHRTCYLRDDFGSSRLADM